MAKAFQCDACDALEAGQPAQTVTIKPTLGNAIELQLCSGCLASHNDWRASRAPQHDKPEGVDA